VVVEADAVIAEAQPQFRRIDIGEPFHIAFLGREKASQAVQQIDSSLAVDGATSALVCSVQAIFLAIVL
jgi:hypothetical protein